MLIIYNATIVKRNMGIIITHLILQSLAGLWLRQDKEDDDEEEKMSVNNLHTSENRVKK